MKKNALTVAMSLLLLVAVSQVTVASNAAIATVPQTTSVPVSDTISLAAPIQSPTLGSPAASIQSPAPVSPATSTPALSASVDVVPEQTASPAINSAPLPTCTYADVRTPKSGYADWQTTRLDTVLTLPASYAPKDLVSVSRAGISGTGSVRSLVISDLAALASAARSAKARLKVVSAYRSYSTQRSTFAYWVRVGGRKAALLTSARPGHSEHQLGTAIDFASYGGALPWTYRDWAKTAAGAWMAANAWKYGFIESYPRGVSPSKTCYAYEPWHFRYVGRAEAAAVHASGLTLREWLWRNTVQ